MKKVLVAVLVVAISMIAAGSAMAAISGSAHDMTSVATFATRHLSSCQFCHAPHNPVSITAAPLWNRATTSGVTNNYSFYASATAVSGIGTQSATCLSCHDGATSIKAATIKQGGNADGGAVTSAVLDAAGVMTSSAAVAGDAAGLSNDHPINVIFGATGAYAGVVPAASLVASGNVYVVNGTPWRGYGVAGSQTVQCSSCHDPHGDDYTDNTDNSPFLRGSIQTICSDCHQTK